MFTRKEQKELLLGQLLPRALPLANTERYDPLIRPELAIAVYEALREEVVWPLPIVGVSHHVVEVAEDGGAAGDHEAADLGVLLKAIAIGWHQI